MSVAEKSTLGRVQWILAALDVLAFQGVGGVRVQRLARDIGVTTGSFYWHFRDRAELIDQVLLYWEREITGIIVAAVTESDAPPLERLRQIAEWVVENEAGRYDLAFRAWGSCDKRVAEVVERVDRTRLDTILDLFRAAGFDGADAEMRARTFLYYLEMEHAFYAREAEESRRELLELRLEMLFRPA